MADNNMAKPKMSMLDLFQKYRDCYDYRKDPTIEEQQTAPEARQLMAERFRERKQAAREYANIFPCTHTTRIIQTKNYNIIMWTMGVESSFYMFHPNTQYA